MTHILPRLALGLACAALLCTGGLQKNLAQNNQANAAPRRLGLVNEYTIKQGMMGAYLQLAEKEGRPLYLKAGIKEAYFFTNLYDTASRNVVTLVEMHDSFAAIRARNEAFTKNNSQEARDAWGTKVREFITDTRTSMVEGLPDLTWVNPKLKSPALYYNVVERFVALGRARDYEAYLKNDYLPLVKKADANGIVVSRLRYGGEFEHYFVFSPVVDLTELDQPSKITQAAGGADAMAKMQQKLVGVVQRSENRILRLQPQLSIIPAASTAAK
jgi:hypothetical protein